MVVDLNSLPEISFTETDPSKIEAKGMAVHEAITGKTLSPGDPERLFIEALLYRVSLTHQEIQHSAFMNLVLKAEKAFLDYLGAEVDCPRLGDSAATTTIRFLLVEAQASALIIPAGTRITPDNSLMFATDVALEIPAGETEGDVGATCQTVGAAGNGFLAGQISKLVQSLAYVSGAQSTTLSAGGADVEKDDPYRLRIIDAPRSFSVAGPGRAYKWWARTAHQDIIDVSYRSPDPGVSEVRPLMKDGVLPTQEILDAVLAICGEDGIRPDTDNVVVLAPEQVSYQVAASYWISSANSVTSASIEAAVEKAYADWLVWQRSKLGRDIDPSELVHRLKAAGAKRVVVTLPEHAVLEKYQVASEDADNCVLTFGGLEDE